uniref:Uncharacterized protein n=1 Tax=Anguilla anguilla TaxID=7936 RepID=A0A0E9UJ63_ANGAN
MQLGKCIRICICTVLTRRTFLCIIVRPMSRDLHSTISAQHT